jgi:hypothetical protein
MENKKSGSRRKGRRFLVILLAVVLLLAGAAAGLTYLGQKAAGSLLSMTLSEPIGGATSATVTIDPGDGNLTLEQGTGSEHALASGTLQYYENIGAPLSQLAAGSGIATLNLSAGGGQPWLKLPWSACNGGPEWLIRLNPLVAYDVTALTGGGNIKIDLRGLTITRLEAVTGGGNMEVMLPDNGSNLDIQAKTGAGKVTVTVGSGVTGSNVINASSGAGEVTVLLPRGIQGRVKVTQGNAVVDPGFNKIDATTFETPDYQNAADKVDITVGSGLGKVNVIIK